MAIPNAFVSYSHDSQEHKKWVLELATRLRNSGIDAVLDQWELQPGDDLPHFMEKHLASADRVLMVCTERYVEKANAGKGGVGYEKMIITADLMKSIDSRKIIPLVRQTGTLSLPTFLKSKLFVDFSRLDQFEFACDELVRSIHSAPLFVKPPVGNNPFTPVGAKSPERTGDAVLQLMKIVVDDFERGKPWSAYESIRQKISVSRVMTDLLIERAKADGLVTQDSYNDLFITGKGKHYALEHGLVK